jgi:dihydropteroate synthase
VSIDPRPGFQIPLPSGRTLQLGPRTLVMGIVNITPDSFADGGLRLDPDAAITGARALVEAGADLVDIGAESTRPGATPIEADEEWRRLAPVLEGLRGILDVPISVDTYRASTATGALSLGADIINDVSALEYDPPLAGVVRDAGCAVVLMHNRGRSAAMYDQARYEDVVAAVMQELSSRLAVAQRAGIAADAIIVDPGIGFAKRAAQSFAALADLARLHALGRPILSGPSLKSYLNAALGSVPAAERGWGTAAAVTASVLAGAHIVRVHDVRAMAQVVKVADALRNAAPAASNPGLRKP